MALLLDPDVSLAIGMMRKEKQFFVASYIVKKEF